MVELEAVGVSGHYRQLRPQIFTAPALEIAAIPVLWVADIIVPVGIGNAQNGVAFKPLYLEYRVSARRGRTQIDT